MKLRLRYSLRGFLLAAGVLAAITAWFSVEYLQRFRAEANVLRHLTSIGCDVQMSMRKPQWFWHWFGDDVALQASSLDLSHMPAGDFELSQIADLSGLEGLYLDDTNVTDDGVVQLAGRIELVALSLRNTSIRRLPPLAGMSRLLHLDLSNTAIDAFNAADLYSLEYLSLAGTQISDDALSGIGRLSKLQTMDISRNRNIADRGIAYLKRSKFPRLTRIYLWETSVTADGAAVLKTEFPGAAINWDGRDGSIRNMPPARPGGTAIKVGK